MVLHSPSPLRAVKCGPNPQKWPDNMQRKKTHPTSNMNGVGMRMITFFREGANKQVISSQADSLIKISRIWADFFPANTSNQPI